MREQLTTRPFNFMGATTLTVSTTVVPVNPANIPNGASGAIVGNAVGAGDVHWSADSSVVPSATSGIPLRAGDSMIFRDGIANLKLLRFIRVSSDDGKLFFQFLTE